MESSVDMLESQVLWLLAAEPTERGRSRSMAMKRRVLAGSTQTDVGQIIEHPLRWWPWRIRARIAAFEGPDASAVFSGRRAGWLPADWDVFDADSRMIGLLRGPYLFAADGTLVGTQASRQPRRSGRIIDPDANSIARWQPEPNGVRLEFSDILSQQPFIKMTVITAAVIGL